MSGRHSWNRLFEATFSPEQRARIIRDADKLLDDNRLEPHRRPVLRREGATPQDHPQPRATTSTR